MVRMVYHILLKNVALEITLPLTLIFRRSFDSGILPNDWLQAIIIAIFKRKGANSCPANYRPVSLTSVCCKIFETLLKEALLDYLFSKGLINRAQHGFLKLRSTLTNLFETFGKWLKAVDQRKFVHAVYIDLAKAFDSVSHPKLLHKLKAYGIAGKLLTWISAFLSNRSQRVKVGDSLYNPAEVLSGVPQGSVLGRILFLLYINDLPDEIRTCEIKMFADDVKIYTISDDRIECPVLSEGLAIVHRWSTVWQLSLAVAKCSVTVFGGPPVEDAAYRIGGQALEYKKRLKILVSGLATT